MDEYKHIVNCLGARYGMAQAALMVDGKEAADKIMLEAEEWLRKTYKIERKVINNG